MTKAETKRPRGRPRSVDREAVLHAATKTFWRLGYDGASLGELTAAMGVSRPTLYATYGDKDALFLSVIDQYAATYGTAPMQAFQAESDIKAAVTAFLNVSARGNTEPDMPRGCLLACCAAMAAETNPDVREKLHYINDMSAKALADRFAQESRSGALNGDIAPQTRAALMMDMMNAQAVRARTGEARQSILDGVADRVNAVVGPQA